MNLRESQRQRMDAFKIEWPEAPDDVERDRRLVGLCLVYHLAVWTFRYYPTAR